MGNPGRPGRRRRRRRGGRRRGGEGGRRRGAAVLSQKYPQTKTQVNLT